MIAFLHFICQSVYSAYATKDFVYSDDDFLDDYEGNSFNIEKYDILGIDDGFSVRINYDETKDKKVSSIFLVIPLLCKIFTP